MLKTENLKLANDLKDTCNSDIEKKKVWEKEISMLKTENLKLANDLKAACNSDIEKKKVLEKEIIAKKIAQEARIMR